MSHNVLEEPVGDTAGGAAEESAESPLPAPGEAGEIAPPDEPKATFQGNFYDLASLGALATGALILFSCLTCNLGYYCLPFLPIALGAVGVLSARQAVEAERTRLWSWLGIAAGGIFLLFLVAAIVLYVGFIVLMATTNGWG
jgi:hypothetical protein